jgi:hypothetical protein
MPGDQPKDSTAAGRGGRREGGTKDRLEELAQLVVAYIKQEALEPVTAQLKAMAKGIGGALLLALGTVLLAVGFVRALQAEFGSTGAAGAANLVTSTGGPRGAAGGYYSILATGAPYGIGHHLSGNWSWAPYMGGALFAIVVAVFCVTRIRGGAVK